MTIHPDVCTCPNKQSWSQETLKCDNCGKWTSVYASLSHEASKDSELNRELALAQFPKEAKPELMSPAGLEALKDCHPATHANRAYRHILALQEKIDKLEGLLKLADQLGHEAVSAECTPYWLRDMSPIWNARTKYNSARRAQLQADKAVEQPQPQPEQPKESEKPRKTGELRLMTGYSPVSNVDLFASRWQTGRYYECVDCGARYPEISRYTDASCIIIKTGVFCNGAQITLCPYCRPDSGPGTPGL